jgi:hypothetical protein
MKKVSPKASRALCLSLAVAAVCISAPQQASAAGFFQDNSQLDITGNLVMTSLSPVVALQFLNYAGAPAPYDTYGNYFVSGGTGTFAGLPTFTQVATYNIRSITQGQPNTSPFLRLGPISTAAANSGTNGVRFVLDNPVFTTQSSGGIDFVLLEGAGRWQVWNGSANGGQGEEVQGEVGFTSQRFQRLANNTVSYSATFTVVPEPSEVLGLFVVGASGALTLLRRRRLMSASK